MNIKRKEILRNTYLKSLNLVCEVGLHNLWTEALQGISKTYGFSGKEDCSFLAIKIGFTFEFFMREVEDLKKMSVVCESIIA
ncbi:MAG: hypothetical protein L3J07_03770 [Candidatus Magasanikbacteria bacterium]|nr:hypothetical protein [Candidatus Magasanikbacteria bacterium]